MLTGTRLIAGAAALFIGAMTVAAPARAQGAGVAVGNLTCSVAGGWGFIFGSSKALNCNYSGAGGRYEQYTGSITKFGVDIGYTKGGVIVWTVVAPSPNIGPGSLAGNYVGGTASASAGVGVGANALVGGSGNSIALQPLSIEGNQGLNIAAGIGAIALRYRR